MGQKYASLLCVGGEESSSGPSPLVLSCGPEEAGKPGTDGLYLRAAEPVCLGRTRVKGFLASAGAWEDNEFNSTLYCQKKSRFTDNFGNNIQVGR